MEAPWCPKPKLLHSAMTQEEPSKSRLSMAKAFFSTATSKECKKFLKSRYRGLRRRTPLHIACMQRDPYLVTLFLVHGANPNALDILRCNPLLAMLIPMAVPGQCSSRTLRARCAEPEDDNTDTIAHALIAHGLDVNAQAGRFPRPTLSFLAARTLVRTMRLLLAHGANPNAVDDFRRTPLFLACTHHGSRGSYSYIQRREATVRALLEAGADPSISAAVHCKVKLNNPLCSQPFNLHPFVVSCLWITFPSMSYKTVRSLYRAAAVRPALESTFDAMIENCLRHLHGELLALLMQSGVLLDKARWQWERARDPVFPLEGLLFEWWNGRTHVFWIRIPDEDFLYDVTAASFPAFVSRLPAVLQYTVGTLRHLSRAAVRSAVLHSRQREFSQIQQELSAHGLAPGLVKDILGWWYDEEQGSSSAATTTSQTLGITLPCGAGC